MKIKRPRYGWEGSATAMNSPRRLFDAAGEPKQLWAEEDAPRLGMYGDDPLE
jgi:hypothetical protein